MKGKYKIEVYNNSVRYVLEIKRNITIIKGDSATGKTQLVRMISLHEQMGASSGITIKCERPCMVVGQSHWDLIIRNTNDSIIFIDEGNNFVRSTDFARCIKDSSNYYVIIAREKLDTLPYSIHAIYGLRETAKSSEIRQIYNETYQLYGIYTTDRKMKPQVLITEDKNAGYQFFNSVCKATDIKCDHADGKSNVYKKIKEYRESGSSNIAAIVDGAAFGPQVDKVVLYLKAAGGIMLLVPESFEWLILKAGIIWNLDDGILQKPYCYIDSQKYFSWERYFNGLLRELTNKTEYAYDKTNLNKIYLNPSIVNKILKLLPNLELK